MILLVGLTFLTGMVAAQDEGEFETFAQDLKQQLLRPFQYVAITIGSLASAGAGLTYITSGDNPGRQEKAKDALKYIAIGIVVSLAAPEFMYILGQSLLGFGS